MLVPICSRLSFTFHACWLSSVVIIILVPDSGTVFCKRHKSRWNMKLNSSRTIKMHVVSGNPITQALFAKFALFPSDTQYIPHCDPPNDSRKYQWCNSYAPYPSHSVCHPPNGLSDPYGGIVSTCTRRSGIHGTQCCILIWCFPSRPVFLHIKIP